MYLILLLIAFYAALIADMQIWLYKFLKNSKTDREVISYINIDLDDAFAYIKIGICIFMLGVISSIMVGKYTDGALVKSTIYPLATINGNYGKIHEDGFNGIYMKDDRFISFNKEEVNRSSNNTCYYQIDQYDGDSPWALFSMPHNKTSVYLTDEYIAQQINIVLEKK